MLNNNKLIFNLVKLKINTASKLNQLLKTVQYLEIHGRNLKMIYKLISTANFVLNSKQTKL